MFEINPNRISAQDRIIELIKNTDTLLGLDDYSTIDMSLCEFYHPVAVMPLLNIIRKKNLIFKNLNRNMLRDGLGVYGFDANHYVSNIYSRNLPIVWCRLPVSGDPTETGAILNHFSKEYQIQILYTCETPKKKLSMDAIYSIRTILSEALENIREHAEAKTIYISAKYYPKSELLDLCVVDDGIGIPGSFHKNSKIQGLGNPQDGDNPQDGYCFKHIAAGRLASSVKTELKQPPTRGTGIYEILQIARTSGKKGQIILYSGSGLLTVDGNDEPEALDVPMLEWDGTLLYVRIHTGNITYKPPSRERQ